MGKTGEKCGQSGIYQGGCNCSKQIALSEGETFPPCSGCRHAVTWKLIRATR